MDLSALLEPVLTAAQIAAAILLFARTLPPRPGFRARAVVVAAVVLVFVPFATWVSVAVIPDITATYSNPVQFVLFSLVLVALVPALLFLYDVPVWTSFFCCTAGYTLQNLASGLAALIGILWGAAGLPGAGGALALVVAYGVATLIAYPICSRVLLRRVRHEGLDRVQNRGMLAMLFLVVLVVILFDIANKSLPEDAVPLSLILTLRCVHIVVCAFVLFAEYEMLYGTRWHTDAAVMEQLVADSERQYRLSQQNIEAINIKCHDLKHQVRSLREGGAAVSERALDELEEAVGIYDAAVKTGNEALDIILSEKSLICEQNGITLSCIADGACLAHVEPSDLYSFFGNALDNAIEAVLTLPDQPRRSVSLVVREVHGAASIHLENFFAGEVSFRDGLPQTSKRDARGARDEANHGFGLRSMRMVCERYGGTLTTSAEGGVFKLDALIPLA